MQENLYYLGRWRQEKFHVYCLDGTWKLGKDCEALGWKDRVVVLNSKEIYDLKDKLLDNEGKTYWNRDEIFACCNTRQRSVYAFNKWVDTSEADGYWQVLGKCIAGCWDEACNKFGVSFEEGERASSRVVHYSDLRRHGDEVLEKIDSMAITH